MSRLVAISQRVIPDSSHGERRDALDQRWAAFLLECDLIPVLLPNHAAAVDALFTALPLAGLVLTGGGDLAAYGGDAPERDAAETVALGHCRARRLPVLGICRGMQMIQHAFGVKLIPVSGHVARPHAVAGLWARAAVNSYHQWGSVEAGPFQVLARADDGVIEGIRHPAEPVQAIMWHPERDKPFCEHDLFRHLFQGPMP
jgi:putative glutamine amidotransferase